MSVKTIVALMAFVLVAYAVGGTDILAPEYKAVILPSSSIAPPPVAIIISCSLESF